MRLTARQVRRLWLGLAAGCLAALGVTLCLPFEPYIAWQQSAGTQLFHSRWVYERLHHDQSPIEVAIVGSSKLESGISPRGLSRALERRLGRRVPVANLSVVMPGRDFADQIVAQLLATHPEVRLILLSDDGAITNSHPMFRETASAQALVRAPRLVNPHYAINLLALPYRNLANFAQQQRPGWFGVAPRFNPSDYLGTDLDRTLGYRTPEGQQVNGDLALEPARLSAMSRAAVARQEAGLAWFRYLPPPMRLAIERQYLGSIARRARAAHVRLAVVAIPFYGPVQPVENRSAYRAIGPVIALDTLSSRADYYQSAAHLNRKGALAASQALAAALAPLLTAGRVGEAEEARSGA